MDALKALPKNSSVMDSLTPEVRRIVVPHNFNPRSYQKPIMAAMDNGCIRGITVWHRRAGKDKTWLQQLIKSMILKSFCGTYLDVFPKLTQGRRDLWDAKSSPDSGGLPFRAHFPPELVMESSETEMQITLRPMPHQKPQPIPDGKGGMKYVGSVFQIMGTDKESLENIRGINAAGVVFSEFSDQNPAAWTSILEPVLLENKGWAGFNYTPKGKDHAYALHQAAKKDDSWFHQLLTVEDTLRDAEGESGEPVISYEQIQALRDRGVAEEIIQQEYYCSYEGFLHGTIFGDKVKEARKDNRIGRMPYMSQLPVGLMFDIGRTDATAIWFYQIIGSEIRFIDYYANTRQGADHYAKICRERPYLYGLIILPHDARVKGYTASQNTEDYFRETLCRNVIIADKISVQAGIDATRRMFSRFTFDEDKCNTRPHPLIPSGLEGLAGYRRAWDETKNDYSGEPVHDAFSHPADSLRTGAVGWQEGMHFLDTKPVEIKVESEFDPRIPSMAGR